MFSGIEVEAEEKVGIVTLDGEIVQLVNISLEPTKGFIISGGDILEWFISGKAKASWHTHNSNSANLSSDDYLGFSNWPNMDHYIVSKKSVHRYYTVDGAILEDIDGRVVR